MSYLSGKTGSVVVAPATITSYSLGGIVNSSLGTSAQIAFGEWRIEMEVGTPEVTNFNTAPFAVFVPGIIRGTGECDMPGYDYGNVGLAVGGTYQVNFNYSSSISIPVTAILKKLSPANKADGTPTLKVSWQITGSFGITIA